VALCLPPVSLEPTNLYRLTCLLLIALFFNTAHAKREVPRHAQELRALTEPDKVLADLPALIDAARAQRNMRELALLYLAQANACRVIADWACQRSAGGSAREAAVLAGDAVLEVRGLIADSRASIAMQDFLRGERLLGEAEVKLKQGAQVRELIADVYLAYSSLSFTLGRFELSQTYAERGLSAMADYKDHAIRARLLRNLGRAQAQLGQAQQARESLTLAHASAAHVDDPKLSAELFLETARLANVMNDLATQRESGLAVLAMGARLKNSQLAGQAHEVLGIAELAAKDPIKAELELRAARDSFVKLDLERDEYRVLRRLLGLIAKRAPAPNDLNSLSARFVLLSEKIEREDRAKAAADFEARAQFIASEMQVKQLQTEAQAGRERETLLRNNNRLAYLAAALFALTLAVLAGFFISLGRNKRLAERLARTDTLTGIANRRQFDERLTTALARAKRLHTPLTLLAFDIDKFKSINDTHGHAIGDAVIVEFAKRISASVREGDLPARLGGDEFFVLIEDAQSAQVGEAVAKKMVDRMRQPMQIGALNLPVTTSIGVGFAYTPETTASILDLADRALYEAKSAGRNTFRRLLASDNHLEHSA
jgi:diguanylate cyclase (GGDEF)-like protein